MDNQQIFDTAATHMLQQGERSVYGNICAYRAGDTGLKCAIGCLIPDKLYNPSMEGQGVTSPKVYNALREVGIVVESGGLLLELQQCHDRTMVEDWKEDLLKISVKYNLNADCVTNFKKVQ